MGLTKKQEKQVKDLIAVESFKAGDVSIYPLADSVYRKALTHMVEKMGLAKFDAEMELTFIALYR